jgi:hypothetical protein
VCGWLELNGADCLRHAQVLGASNVSLSRLPACCHAALLLFSILPVLFVRALLMPYSSNVCYNWMAPRFPRHTLRVSAQRNLATNLQGVYVALRPQMLNTQAIWALAQSSKRFSQTFYGSTV